MQNKHVIIFKNITDGFMNLEYINYLAELFSKEPSLKNKITFILDNNLSLESNQALMQMYNQLIGFDIFEAAYSNGKLLEYKELNQLQLRREVKAISLDLSDYLDNKYSNFKKYFIENSIYENVLSIIKGVL